MSPNPWERVQEALDIYYRYWESYLTGNQEEFTEVIDDPFELIGTSESEICHNKAEGIDFFNSQKSEIDTSKKTESGIEFSVADIGSGIPDSIIEKIFLPFFTTKPTGSGTGLGLSLSYDIVQANGGNLSVESEEGKGTIFHLFFPNT